MAEKSYVGDIGTDIILECGEDITGATGTKIKWKKSDDSTGEWDAEIYDDPESEFDNSALKYTTEAGDLNLEGTLKMQNSLTLGIWTGLGETVSKWIYAPFG